MAVIYLEKMAEEYIRNLWIKRAELRMWGEANQAIEDEINLATAHLNSFIEFIQNRKRKPIKS